MKIIFKIVVFVIILSSLSKTSYAKENFSSHYEITYDISDNETTKVSQNIELKNNSQDFFAKEYTLLLSSGDIDDIDAYQNNQALPVNTVKSDDNTKITIPFPRQAVGAGNIQKFKLTYSTKSIAKRMGEIWEVTLPRLALGDDLNEYSIVVNVPEDFPSLAIPNDPTISSHTQDGKTSYNIPPNFLNKRPLLLYFGKDQYYNFSLVYHLKNESIQKGNIEIALPPDINSVQEVAFLNLLPQTEKIKIDEDGNIIASYEVEAGGNLDVTLEGMVKITGRSDLSSFSSSDLPNSSLTTSQKFWEVADPKISEVSKSITDKYTEDIDKAKAIYSYIIENFTYNEGRLNSQVERLGAKKALESPDQLVCMEFTDLFIALARAAGLPARELNGYAYTGGNPELPLIADILHSWPEVFIKGKGFIQIDPTWASTSGGLDYFEAFDPNHFVLAIKGQSSTYPFPAGQYKLTDKTGGDLNITFASKDQINQFKQFSSGFAMTETHRQVNNLTGDIELNIEITNTSSKVLSSGQVSVTNNNTLTNYELELGELAPFAKIHKTLKIKPSSRFFYAKDNISVFITFLSENGDIRKSQKEIEIEIQPFYTSKWFIICCILLGILLGFYLYGYYRISKVRKQDLQKESSHQDPHLPHPDQSPNPHSL